MTIPGTLVPIQNFTVPSTGQGFANVALYSLDGRDGFVISVFPDGTQSWPGPVPPAFTTNQMRVGFHKQVPAPKEMWIFSPDEQSHVEDRLSKSSDLVHWHDLIPGNTLVFRKFDANSNLLAVYRLDKDQFWNAFKGKILLFNWAKDA